MNASLRVLIFVGALAFVGVAIGQSEPISPIPSIPSECPPLNGTGNNPVNPTWGEARHVYRRAAPADYTGFQDGVLSLSPRLTGPNDQHRDPRMVSNIVHQIPYDLRNDRFMSDFVTFFGQFLDHDIGETATDDSPDNFVANPVNDPLFNINVPRCDPIQDRLCQGVTLPFARGEIDEELLENDGVYDQINLVTSFIDANLVYGMGDSFEPGRLDFLRENSGGRLWLPVAPGPSDADVYAPYNLPDPDFLFNGHPVPFTIKPPEAFHVYGDVRANEQPTLFCLHTLFAREHNYQANRLASFLRSQNGHDAASDEEIFNYARKIVIAELQKITYEDWIPALLGGPLRTRYTGYNESVDPRTFMEFQHGIFRMGHTLLNDIQQRLEDDGTVSPAGPIALVDGFFSPERVLQEGGCDPLFRGMSHNRAQEIDSFVIDTVRNMLFGPPLGSRPTDLASLNIQRSRDFGIPDYNTVREAFGLRRNEYFDEISSHREIQFRLLAAFGNASIIDPWSGAISEDHFAGSSVGELIYTVITEQFTNLRDGDRFFYMNPDYLLNSERAEVRRTTLSDIIRRNTNIQCISDNVFFVDPDFDWCGAGTRQIDGGATSTIIGGPTLSLR